MNHLEALHRHLESRRSMRRLPPVICADGFKMSVQAGAGMYCSPRDDIGPWTEVEIGFPNRIEPLLWDYAETPGAWTETVYPHVPIELAAAVIELHGGIDPREVHLASAVATVEADKEYIAMLDAYASGDTRLLRSITDRAKTLLEAIGRTDVNPNWVRNVILEKRRAKP